jgi:hypothetical protein
MKAARFFTSLHGITTQNLLTISLYFVRHFIKALEIRLFEPLTPTPTPVFRQNGCLLP